MSDLKKEAESYVKKQPNVSKETAYMAGASGNYAQKRLIQVKINLLVMMMGSGQPPLRFAQDELKELMKELKTLK
jgi:hypothetical protein